MNAIRTEAVQRLTALPLTHYARLHPAKRNIIQLNVRNKLSKTNINPDVNVPANINSCSSKGYWRIRDELQFYVFASTMADITSTLSLFQYTG